MLGWILGKRVSDMVRLGLESSVHGILAWQAFFFSDFEGGERGVTTGGEHEVFLLYLIQKSTDRHT